MLTVKLPLVSSRGWIRAEYLNRVNARTFSDRIVFFRWDAEDAHSVPTFNIFFHLRDQRKAQLHSFCVAWCPWLTSGEASAATLRSYSCGNAPEAKCWRWQLASVSSRGWIRAAHLNWVNAHTFSNRIFFSAVHVTPWIPREVPFRSWLDYDTKILRQMIMYYILYIVSTALLFFALPSPVLVFHMSLYSTCVISQRCRVGVLPLRVINL